MPRSGLRAGKPPAAQAPTSTPAREPPLAEPPTAPYLPWGGAAIAVTRL